MSPLKSLSSPSYFPPAALFIRFSSVFSSFFRAARQILGDSPVSGERIAQISSALLDATWRQMTFWVVLRRFRSNVSNGLLISDTARYCRSVMFLIDLI